MPASAGRRAEPADCSGVSNLEVVVPRGFSTPPPDDPPLDDPPLPPILPTHPDWIRSLWERVGSVAAMSNRGKASGSGSRRPGVRGGGSRIGSQTGKPDDDKSSVPASLFDPSESQATPESTATYGGRTMSPRNSKFTKLVLHPRGIFINDTNSIVPSAFSHFGTSEPPEGETVEYRRVPGLEGGDGIWVMLDASSIKDIAAEYKEMRGLGLCEEEFATFAKTHFLRGELRSRNVSEDRRWRVDRMLQLVCPPKESAHWRVPPIVADGAATLSAGDELPDLWTWDVRPDCAYWLSLRGFNPRYRFRIRNCAFVRDWVTCPYLTVEFKRYGESEDVAIRQVCAAGALALFNRWHLHAEARTRSRSGLPDLEDYDAAIIRHYTLTFVGHEFVFWVLMPTRDEEGRWAGCVMKRLFGADCTDEYAVRELTDWINEIHRWGLSQYGPSCERDIKIVLNMGGVRTSAVHEST